MTTADPSRRPLLPGSFLRQLPHLRPVAFRISFLPLWFGCAATPLSGALLHQTDFNSGNPWPAAAAFTTGAATASAALQPVGTIDTADAVSTPAVALHVDASRVLSGAWNAGITSGRLAVTNTETHLGKLTVGFDLATSLVRPVRVRIQSFASATAAAPTGTLETTVVPPVATSFFRHSRDLSTFTAVGTGAFDPLAPFIQFQFEINSADGTEPWPASAGHLIRIDNVSYTSPAFYVASQGGNNANDGRSEASPLATLQRAIDLAQPGDVIILLAGTHRNSTDFRGVRIEKSGTPSRWIVLRAHPDGEPAQILSGASNWSACRMNFQAAYIEIRGLSWRGHRRNVTLEGAIADHDGSLPTAAYNGNGIDILGDDGSASQRAHHIRVIGNIIFEHPGGGGGANLADYITWQGNTISGNCWYMRYGGSGLSFKNPVDVDGLSSTAPATHKMFILGNVVYRNQCFVKWKRGSNPVRDSYSDGNGIILDYDATSPNPPTSNYAGRTLVQNNLSFANGGSGIHSLKQRRLDIVNNTAVYNGQTPGILYGPTSTSYGQIFVQNTNDANLANNILWAQPGNPLNSVSASVDRTNVNVVYRHNLLYGEGNNFIDNSNPANSGNQTLRPRFARLPALAPHTPTPDINADVGSFDFRLLPDSPGINAALFTVVGAPRTDLAGTARPLAGELDIGAYETDPAPAFSLQPAAKVVAPGGAFLLQAAATGAGNTYQWLRHGVALAGDTESALYRATATDAETGDYTVRVTNASGSVTSAVARVTLDPAASRLINLSCRTSLAPGALVIPGFTLAGTGRKTVLIRAIGPGLAPFGLTGMLADPQLRVFKDSAPIAANDNWDAAQVGDAFTRVGAFPLPAASRDSALLVTLDAPGGYTVQVSGAGSGSGVVLVEIYDADTAAGATSRLSNVSVRGQSGSADTALILGLVFNGTGARALLARGGGPALAAFGVPNPLADPQLTVFDATRRAILSNDDWGSSDFLPQLETARVLAGAFAYRSASKDSAILANLAPGSYSLQVTAASASPAGGEALVEVYELP